MILEQIQVGDKGRQLAGSFLLPFLYTGTIKADFHMSGKAPWFSDA